MPALERTHIGVARYDRNGDRVANYINITAALRALAGTPTELTAAETRRIRALLRSGNGQVRDSRGYYWRSVGFLPRVAPTTVAAAVAETFQAVARGWDELTFGIELELVPQSAVAVADPIRAARRVLVDLGCGSWKAIYDGSVSGGCEVVSPILKGQAGLDEVTRVAEALKAAGFTANTCGETASSQTATKSLNGS